MQAYQIIYWVITEKKSKKFISIVFEVIILYGYKPRLNYAYKFLYTPPIPNFIEISGLEEKMEIRAQHPYFAWVPIVHRGYNKI
jgi:hypothetical protein